jgi:hypothetical protein
VSHIVGFELILAASPVDDCQSVDEVIGDAGASTNSEVELGLLAIHTLVAGGGNKKRGPGDVVRIWVAAHGEIASIEQRQVFYGHLEAGARCPLVGQRSSPFHVFYAVIAEARTLLTECLVSVA